MKPLDDRFGSFVATLTSIGQLTALVGLAMFSLSLILIARIPKLEPLFGGLDRIFHAHRHLGSLGFLLMLIHPLALGVRFVPVSVESAALFFVPSLIDIPKALGIIALLLMMALIGITLFAHWKYQILLKTHRYLGMAFMLGAIHGFLIPSDISNNIWLALYSGALAVAGVGAYFYRTIFSRMIPKHHFSVVSVQELSKDITEITMEPEETPLSFTPGQFIFVRFMNGNVSEEIHPFSISSAPNERNLRITVKNLGDYTADLPHLAVGATAEVEGPFGGFTEEKARTPYQIWIAGGIGITPFLSRARALASDPGTAAHIDLYYTTNSREEMLFLQELQQIAARNPQLTIIPHACKEAGYLSASVLAEKSGTLMEKDIFVCGPPSMMSTILRQCRGLGVRSKFLHAEEFSMI
jgi:predicted ferric reductase